MKAGDLVGLKNLHPCWGSSAVVIKIHEPYQIYLLSGCGESSIPWDKRDRYISGVLNESR